MAKESETSSRLKQLNIMKNSVKQTIETITLSAQVAISKCENQMEYVQVLPENPRKGLVKPFSGRGHGQMMDDGTFDFVRKRRIKRKPVLKLPHTSLSFGADGYDRCTFVLPSEQRHEFARLLKQEIARVRAFMNENY